MIEQPLITFCMMSSGSENRLGIIEHHEIHENFA